MSEPLRVLIVEDSEDDALLVVRHLQKGDWDVVHKRVDTPQAMAEALEDRQWDAIISDYSMPHFNGMDALQILRQSGRDIPFLILSGTIGEETAVAAMRAGAQDYLMKDNLMRLGPAIKREVGEAAVRRNHRQAEVEKKRLEEQLRLSQRMEVVGRLAGGTAHDFNNLLVPIIGHAEMCLRENSSAEPLHSQLQEIYEAAVQARELTGKLLAFGRKQTLEMKVLNLNEEVRRSEKILRSVVSEDIELNFVLCEKLGAVRADPTQIQQILMNLVINAGDAMPHGGKITVETANVELDEAYAVVHRAVKPGPFVLLAVSDTGEGMDAETQEHMFEPFFTTKDHDKGTGLGLSTVYGIVKQHRGSIWAYSEPGRGTVIKTYLPRVDETPQARQSHSPQPVSVYGEEVILLVEDDRRVRDLAREILISYGYDVISAKDAHQALQLAGQKDGPIHLLLSDVVMPKMNGRELYQHLTSARPGVKVLYMSGYTDDVIGRHGILEEGTAFLQKPFSMDALAQKVRQVLDGT